MFCIVLLVLACSRQSFSASYGVQATFTKNNSEQEATEVASNVLRVNNFGNKTVRFRVVYSVPTGWEILGSAEKSIELGPNDSTFIPLRIIPEKLAKGGTSYIITVSLISEDRFQFASQNWYVTIRSHSQWIAKIPVRQHFFTNQCDSSSFSFNFRNNGNTDEEIKVSLLPDHRLELHRNDGGNALLSFRFSLAPGADTTLQYVVFRRRNTNRTLGKDKDIHHAENREDYQVLIMAKAEKSLGSWSGTAQFSRISNFSRQNDFKHSAIPLTLEANVYDILSGNTTMAIDAYGNTIFDGHRMINYRFQSVFISNYLNSASLLGNNHYIGYFDGKTSLELGEVNGWGRSLLTGRGIKSSYRFGKNTLGAMYTRSPGFFKNNNSEGVGFYHNLTLDKINWSNYASRNTNAPLNLATDIYTSSVSWKINRYHQISTGGGYSTDKYSGLLPASSGGYGYDINYSGNYNRFSFGAGNSFGSKTYAPGRGINLSNFRATWAKNSKHNFSVSSQHFSQQADYFSMGVIVHGNYIRTDRYEFRWGINNVSSGVALRPYYQWDENSILRVASRGLGVDYNARNFSNVRLSVNGFIGYAKAVDYDLTDFFISRTGVSARWEKLLISLRYNYGPWQLSEQHRFINDQINPQSVHLTSTYDYWMHGEKLLLSTTGNFIYETYFDKSNFRLRPELFYYAKEGLRFSIYGAYHSSTQGANPMLDDIPNRAPFQEISASEFNMGFGVRKQLGVPVPGKKFITMKVIVFRDFNGNGKQDANEEGSENILINIKQSYTANDSGIVKKDHGEDFISNTKGEIIYSNIPVGRYIISTQSLVTQNEWFDGKSMEILLDKKKTIFIPLSRGVKLTGTILVQRDKYSEHEEGDLARIRITATDSVGNSFSGLTDRNGSFQLYLPMGNYILTVNESALGDKYTFIQNKIAVDLSRNIDNYNISFNVVEKKRKMEIKKFNNKGEQIENRK
jgi:hypothetical protein